MYLKSNSSLPANKGFHTRDLYTKVYYYKSVDTQESNDLDCKQLLA